MDVVVVMRVVEEAVGKEVLDRAGAELGPQHLSALGRRFESVVKELYRPYGLLEGEEEEDPLRYGGQIATNRTVLDFVEMFIWVSGDKKDRLPTEEYWEKWKEYCEFVGVSHGSKKFLNSVLKDLGYEVSKPSYIDGTTKRCWIGAVLLDVDL